MSAASRILAEVQKNPEILTGEATHVTSLVSQVMEWIRAQCNLPVFPDQLQGTSVSGESPSTNLSALTDNRIIVSVNGSGLQTVELTLAGLTTGNAIATELQSKIQAYGTDWGFDEVTVAYSGGVYTLTSGRYGPQSSLLVSVEDETKQVARALKLSPVYGGTETPGSFRSNDLEMAAVKMVEAVISAVGLEGLSTFSMEGGGSGVFQDLPPLVKAAMSAKRRMFVK